MRQILAISTSSSFSCEESKFFLNLDKTVGSSESNIFAIQNRNVIVFSAYTLELFLKNRSNVKSDKARFVFFYKFWNSLSGEIKSILEKFSISLIATSVEECALINQHPEAYCILYEKSVKEVTQLKDQIPKHIKFFFALDFDQNKDFFSVERAHSIFEALSEFKFESPCGFDRIDFRNSEHLKWNWWGKNKQSHQEGEIEVSLIIPFYNRSRYVKAVLRTLLNQSLPKEKFEVILVDDGSTREEVSALDDAINKIESNLNIRRLYIERNVGLENNILNNRAGPARNFGSSVACGKVLLFLDSDILLPADYLETIVNTHQNHDVCLPIRHYLSQESTDKLLTNETSVESVEEIQPRWTAHLREVFETKDWFLIKPQWKLFMTYALSIKRSIFEESGGFRTNFISYGYEDLDWGFRVCKLTDKLKIVDAKVYHLYHFNDESSEYRIEDLSRDKQLSYTARMFFFQNLPRDANYLINMSKFK